jgi:hypothetical protein
MFLLDPVAVFPKFRQNNGRMKPKEDAKRKCDPLNDNPRKEPEKINLIGGCIHLK